MKQLVKKLKHLQHVAPSNEWKSANKSALLAAITKESPTGEPVNASAMGSLLAVFKSAVSFVLPEKRTFQLLKPAGALFSISLFVLSTGIFSVNASQSTVPGDTLYRLKLATERVQKALTTTEQEKAKLEITFAGRRIEELEKIVNDPVVTEAEKDERVAEVITSFKNNISSAKETLDELKHTDAHDEVVRLAEVIDTKTDEYAETLAEVAEVVKDSKTSKEVVKEAAEDAEKSSDEALTVIAEKHEEGSQVTSEESVAEKVDKKIKEIENTVVEIYADIAFLRTTSTGSVTTVSEGNDDTNTASTTEEILVFEEVSLTKLAGELETVYLHIEEKKFTTALAEIKEIRVELKEIQTAISELMESVVVEEEVVEPVENTPEETTEKTTTTEDIIQEEKQEEATTTDELSVDIEGEELTVSSTEEIEEVPTVQEN